MNKGLAIGGICDGEMISNPQTIHFAAKAKLEPAPHTIGGPDEPVPVTIPHRAVNKYRFVHLHNIPLWVSEDLHRSGPTAVFHHIIQNYRKTIDHE